MSRHDDIVRDSYDRAIPGVSVYVYKQDGTLAALTDDSGGTLANPLTTDALGAFYFNAPDAVYDLRYVSGGKTVREDEVIVGVPVEFRGATGPANSTYTSRTLMAAAPSTNVSAILTEPGVEGIFVWNPANLSTLVTADTYQGLYVPPASAPTGASGAWVRVVEDNIYRLSWFGFSTANQSTNHARWRTLEALLVARGSTYAVRELPAGTFTGFAASLGAQTAGVSILTPGHIRGQGAATVLDPNFTGTTGVMIHVVASDVEISHFKVTRIENDGTNADAFIAINIGSRHTSGSTAGAVTDRIYLHDLIFDNVDNPIRAVRNTWSGPTNFVPTHIRIERILITNCGYQAIVPEADEIDISNFYIQMKATGAATRPFQHAMRIVAGRRVRVTHGRVQDDHGLTAFALMRGGVDSKDNLYGAQFSDAEDIYFNGVHMTGKGVAFNFLETSGTIQIDDCSYRGDPTTTAATGTHFTFGAHQAPMRNSTIKVTGGVYTGVGAAVYLANSNFKRLIFDGVDFVGNSATAGGYSGLVQIDNAGTDALGAAMSGLRMLEFRSCTFLFKDSLYTFGVYYSNAVSGAWYSVRDCVFPFGINIGTSNDLTGTGTATRDGNGTNRTFPTGVWAEQIANFSANPRTTEY